MKDQYRAIVTYEAVGAVQNQLIYGPWIQTQTWPGGMAQVVVRDKRHGKILKVLHIEKYISIEVGENTGDDTVQFPSVSG
jgi:hypothetical protein